MRLKSTLFFMLLVMGMHVVSGQDLITQGASPDLYISHQVAAKETWYSIGRSFNLAPKDIAVFNQASINKPLEIGQQLRIPLTSANFLQTETKKAGEELLPVYHIVQEKEWMYRISVNHNKVPIEQIEKWNSINRDEAKTGMKLIVGFLKVSKADALTIAKNTNTAPPVPAVKQEPVKTDTGKTPAVKQNTPAPNVPGAPVVAGQGGYFKTQFGSAGKNQSAVSGIFKSTSGWNDGKYYALMNNVTVGTIVKINFPQTNRSIYAKVLGELPDMKESAGLALRISDAAARELGAVNNKFSVDVAF